MNISQEKTGDLTALVKVEVKREDYLQAVNKLLKDYQKKASLPGFRPGKVPLGIVKKMFGKSVLAEEVNKVLTEGLNKYLVDNEIKILGHPLPNTDRSPQQDFEMDKDYEFYFDIGLAPDVTQQISDKIRIDYYDIEPDDRFIDQYIEDVRKRTGETENPESAGPGDLIHGEIHEIDHEGKMLEEGLHHHTTIGIDQVKNKEQHEKFIGAVKGDEIDFSPIDAAGSKVEAARMLGIKEADLGGNDTLYRFTIEEIIRIKPSELGKELFDKVFPHDHLETTRDFKERIAEEARINFRKESDNLFMNDAIEKLIREANLALPDEFLKRWLIDSNDGKITPAQVDDEFEHYAKALKWQLIQNKIITDHHIEISENDIRNYIKDYLNTQLHFHGEGEESEKRLDGIVESVMRNKEEVQKIYETLLDQKIKELLKGTLKLRNKQVSYDDFVKLVNEKNK